MVNKHSDKSEKKEVYMIIEGEFDKESDTYRISFTFTDRKEVVRFINQVQEIELLKL